MNNTPKSLRLQIGLFGRTNVVKSSFLNLIAGQDVSITSPVPGTTTDVVEKVMELLPLGPVVFLDTAGVNDDSGLAGARLRKTKNIFSRADVIALIVEPEIWTGYEEEVSAEARKRDLPLVIVVNKTDLGFPSEAFLESLKLKTGKILLCSSLNWERRDETVCVFKKILIESCPNDSPDRSSLIGDLLPPGGLAILIIPIDLEAPKGRLILPQVQTLRDALDNDAAAMVVKEREYRHALENLKKLPDLVVCDSQVVLKMTADTPREVKCTTFSILFSRNKGDLKEMVRGVTAIDGLRTGDKILVAEACSHHAVQDDIGRVKIPRWLRQYTGADLDIRTCAGRDFPDDLSEYKLVIHCGACMLTRREMLARIQETREKRVPVTNYGVCISFLQGVLERVLGPFPAALEAYRQAQSNAKEEIRNGC